MTRERIVLIGAGSTVFTRGLVADLIGRRWEAELVLVDTDPEALAVAEGLTRKMLAAGRAPVRLAAATDRRAVLGGAGAVICTISVGGRRAWERDVLIPRRYGIYQPVGDTVMPGGASRALRMIPPMVDIARDVLDLAPGALLFNYGNPMAPVCRAVWKATGAEVVGLCHGVFGVGRYLAGALAVPPEELKYTAAGINHLTWFTEARHGGRDVMGRLRQMARDALERSRAHATPAERFPHAGARDAPQADPVARDPFSWQLLDLFGAFPAVLDRHVTEFFPHLFRGEKAYYGKTLGVDAYSFEQTVARGDKGFERMREQGLGDRPFDAADLARIGGEHEQVLDIIESLRRDDGKLYSANLPNAGQVPNLPDRAPVESPAVASCGRLRPIIQPPLPPAVAGVLSARLMWVETIVQAALEGSRRKFIQALVLDGAADSLRTAEALADDLLDAQAEHLPQFRQGT